MKPFNVELWQQTADYVLAPLLAEEMVDGNHNHYWRGVQQGMMAYVFPEGNHRQVYLAIQDLINQSKPVHLTTLQTVLDGSVSSDYLAMLYVTYKKGSTISGAVFETNVDTLLDFGSRYDMIKKLQRASDALMNGDKKNTADSIITETVSSLMNSGMTSVENETAEQASDDFEAYMSNEPDNSLFTGIELIDQWLGGFGRGDFMAIAAPMKQRKTSLVLNMLVNMARNGKSVALMMLESDKRKVAASLVSMFAIEYLIKNNLYGQDIIDAHGTKQGRTDQIWASNLMRLQKRYPILGKVRTAAVEHGIRELKSLGSNLRVYDRSKKGGGLLDAASIHRLCLRDKALFDTDFIAIDHAQRIDERGAQGDYEKLIAVVPYLEALARREQVAICLLAQLKASEAEGTGDSHISGVRGGAVLDEAVDYMLITGYKQKMEQAHGEKTRYPNDVLMIGLQHNRYGEGGADKRKFVAIDPNSGLIMHYGKALHEPNLEISNIFHPNF